MTAPLAAQSNRWLTESQFTANDVSGNLFGSQVLCDRRQSFFGGPQRCQTDIITGSKGSLGGKNTMLSNQLTQFVRARL